MRSSIALLLFLFLCVQQPISAQKASSALIDSLVQAAMTTMPHVGLAVAVVQDGQVTHAKGYGIASAGTGKKVDENTLFAIASNSKSFTAAALAILIEEGKLDWNDKVVDHLPEFRMYDPYVTEHFTIIDLLTHRSGLDLGAGDLMFFPDGSDFTARDVMTSFQHQKPVSEFRTKYDYDNLLYIVAGELIARKSGMTWPEFVEARIMRPIGMANSVGVYQHLKDKSNVASPHALESGTARELEHMIDMDPSTAAAGGILASVNDMAKWLQLQLNAGKYGPDLDKQVFSEQNQRVMWRPQTIIGFNARPEGAVKTHFSAYGLGWFISDKNGYAAYEHTGGLPGMLSSTIVLPELNAAAVVLTNADPGGYSFHTLRAGITDLLIGAEPTDWIGNMKKMLDARLSKGDSVLTAVWNASKKADLSKQEHRSVMGTYEDPWFGKVEVFDNGGKLWMRAHRSPKLNGEMFYYRANTYTVKWEYQDMNCDAYAMFTLDENGRATGIRMKGISPNIDFSFDFQHLDLQRVEE